MEQNNQTKIKLINQILRIGHGNLSIYTDTGLTAAQEEPELLAHLIAWNQAKGQVRDSKVALPVLALRSKKDLEFWENAVAHLLLLDPRNLVSAYRFNKSVKPGLQGGSGRLLKDGIIQYVRAREGSRQWWSRTVLQHRESMKSLYALLHIKPPAFAQSLLFDGVKQGVFKVVGELKDMKPDEAAGTILEYKIPFLVAAGALGGIKNKPDLLLALIERMSGNELITNTKRLNQAGVFENPVLKAAYDKAVERTRGDKKVSALKAGRAADAIGNVQIKRRLQAVQEEKVAQLGGIQGDWLVLGDCSGSMKHSMEAARQVAAIIARAVTGNVWLIFFDTHPTMFDVSGKTLDEIQQATRQEGAGGMTSIGCGLDYIFEKRLLVQGIAICSDGGENTNPMFAKVYKRYSEKFDVQPPVYLYHVPGETDRLTSSCEREGIAIEKFELGSTPDYYALPNLVLTMKTSRYTLLDEIMETPLLTLKDVFKRGGE